MPVINGIKMACEPCIRGHRSTKCNHASERVMLPVRKPGRPLSVCPHPPNSSCSCGSVTAAIPRTRKCGCGSKANGSGGSGKSVKSPTKRSFYRPSASPKLTAHGRIDPAILERSDPNPLNMLDAQANWGSPNGSAVGAVQMSGNQNGSFMLPPDTMAYLAAQNGSPTIFTPVTTSFQNGYQPHGQAGSHMYTSGNMEMNFFDAAMDLSLPLGQLPLPGNDMNSLALDMKQPIPAAGQTSTMNGYHNIPYQTAPQGPQTMAPPAVAAEPKRSCCGGGATAPPSSTTSRRHTPTSSINSATSNGGTANSASCCSSTPSVSSSSSTRQTTMKAESVNGGTGTHSMASIPLHRSALNQQVFAEFPSEQGAPAWYRYAPEYGTVSAPLQPDQWRTGLAVSTVQGGVGNGSGNGNGNDSSSGSGSGSGTDFGDLSVHPPFTMSNGVSEADSHMCACGDDCECIGCVAHPYNNATQSTIQSAWTTMMDDAISGVPKSVTSPTTPDVTAAAAVAAAAAVQHRAGADTSSPQQIPTPSDTSGVSDDQISLPPGDFLFVTYPVMGCMGEELTCPCGDDCQCVGCTIHNNEPSLP